MKGIGIVKNEKEAVHWYKKAAQQKNSEALLNLGYCHLKGIGVAVNVTEAIKLFKQSAEEGNVKAYSYIGDCYYEGNRTAKNYKVAFEWYQKAAEQNNPYGQLGLARCYYNGNGVNENTAKAFDNYKKAAEAGLSKAKEEFERILVDIYKKAEAFEDNERYIEAAEYYGLACQADYPAACWRLGELHYYGKGVDKDYAEAVKQYTKASELGSTEAENMLGMCYYNGNGVEQNDATAFSWWKKAAEKGFDFAQHNVGYAYYNGIGVEKDYTEAIKWYTKSAEQGLAIAQYQLADCFLDGLGVDRNIDKAEYWYGKAAEQGSTEAEAGLERCNFERYLDGLEKEIANLPPRKKKVNPNQAKIDKILAGKPDPDYQTLEQAAKLGDAESQYLLGLHYKIDGEVTKEGVNWFRKSAEQGYAPAQEMIADLFQYGIGVNRYPDQAKKWLSKAIENYKEAALYGDYNAAYQLANMDPDNNIIYRNTNERNKWYSTYVSLLSLAARKNDPEAQCSLAECYLEGQYGISQNIIEALKLLNKSYEGGNSHAAYILSNLYFDERYIQTDANKGVEWCRKAAEKGHCAAISRMKECYQDGIGVEKDETKVEYWSQKEREAKCF